MPRRPAAGSVTAKIIATCAVEPEVMNCFVPLSTQRLPGRLALVLRAAASEPAPGSVRQKHESMSPAAIGFRKRCFCYAEPNLRIGTQPTELWTESIVETEPSPA